MSSCLRVRHGRQHTVADGSKAAICGAVGGRECATHRDTATRGDTMEGGALKSCGAGRCDRRGAQGQQAPSTTDEDDEEDHRALVDVVA